MQIKIFLLITIIKLWVFHKDLEVTILVNIYLRMKKELKLILNSI